MLFLIDLIMCVVSVTVAGPLLGNYQMNETRRIINGQPVGDTRPYMVYLAAAPSKDGTVTDQDTDWICGGVIVHERYVLTSAACIEDVKHFVVVSGTSKWIPSSDKDNECLKNGAKKAIWKCVPKAYVYDGDEFDNMRWMAGDIAVVKVEDNFNFEKRVRGCDFVPKKVAYNNRSIDYEKARSRGSIAGWGSTEAFADIFEDKATRQQVNSPVLLESEVQLITGKNCKKRWDPRYHYLINDNMVCTKDVGDIDAMTGVCADREINCKELEYSDSDEYADDDTEHTPKTPENRYRRMMPEPGQLKIHTARHLHGARKSNNAASGGFCENDHGGPLIVGQGKTAMVVGVMSACLTRDVSKKCYGPFLFTSVYRYRNLINCAINKDIGATCRNLLRSSRSGMVETNFDWSKFKEFGLTKHEKLEGEAEKELSVSVANVTNTTSSSTKKMTDAPRTTSNSTTSGTLEIVFNNDYE